MGLESIFIDLTLSDDNETIHSDSEQSITNDCPFDPPLNINGNILTSTHYKILKSPSAWFTDDIINGFFCKLATTDAPKRKLFAFSSFFYTSLLERGKEFCLKHSIPKDFNSFLDSNDKKDKIVMFPINSAASHWVLVTWYINDGTLKYYDSMMCRRSGNRIMKQISEFFNEYLKEKELEEALENLNLSDAKDFSNSAVKLIKNLQIPKGQIQQTDGSSCGPFCCYFAKSCLDEQVEMVDIYEFRESLIEYFMG